MASEVDRLIIHIYEPPEKWSILRYMRFEEQPQDIYYYDPTPDHPWFDHHERGLNRTTIIGPLVGGMEFA